MIPYLFFFIVFAISALLMWKNPKCIIPILVLVVPLQRYSFHFDPMRFSLKVIILLTPLAYFVAWKKGLITTEKIRRQKMLFVLFANLLLGIALSLLQSINVFRSVSFLGFTALTGLFAFLFVFVLESKKDFLVVSKSVCISAFLISLLGIMQFVQFQMGRVVSLPLEAHFSSNSIEAEAFIFSVGENIYLRPSGSFMDANLFGGFLILGVLLCFSLFWKSFKSRDKLRVIGWGIIFVFLFAIFSLTMSRSAYLGLVVGGVMMLAVNRRYIVTRGFVILTIILVTSLLVVVRIADTPIEAMAERAKVTFFEHDPTGSTDEHFLFAKANWEIFKDYPITGIGAGNFEEYYLTEINPKEDTAYSYNVYLGWLAETGIIGFTAQLAFVMYVFWQALKNVLKTSDAQRLLFSSVVFSFLGIMIANLFYAYYILFFVWMVIGLVMAMSQISWNKR